MPAVSVITPTKNRLKLLKETIASVKAQTFEDWEHIIVDDGSNDGTAEETAQWCQAEQRLKYLRPHRESRGANVCRNIGIEASTANLIVFLDSDDLLEPTCLERRLSVMSRNLDLDFAVYTTGFFLLDPGDLGDKSSYDITGDDLLRFLCFEIPWQTSAPIWRKEALERLNGFDEALPSWQDVDLHIRAIASGMKYLRFPIVDHHMRWQVDENKVSWRQRRSPDHLHSAMQLFEKFENIVREGPGMTWIRQRALCSLYFYVAELWIDAGSPMTSLATWKSARDRGLSKAHIYLPGVILLLIESLGSTGNKVGKRLAHKWKGLARFRTNAELLTD